MLTHEIKNVFCSMGAMQRRTNFCHVSTRPHGLQPRCCTPLDPAVFMDLLQTLESKTGSVCSFHQLH